MNCEQIHECLTAFLLGDLDEATRLAVEKHLEQCEGCRAQRRELELTLDLVREALSASSQSAAIPQRLTPDRRANVTSASRVRRSVRVLRWFSMPHPRFALAAAACLVLAFVIAGLMLPGLSAAREKASRGQYCMMEEGTAGPVSLSVVPSRRAQEKGWHGGVPSDSPQQTAVLSDFGGDGVREREANRVSPVLSTEMKRNMNGVVKEIDDSTATIAHKTDSDSRGRSAGKMGIGGVPGAGGSASRAKARGNGADVAFDLALAPVPETPPPPAPPPAPAASAPMKRSEALDGGAGGELRTRWAERGDETASRAAKREPPQMQARLDYKQAPAASVAPPAESAPRPARRGSGGGLLKSVDSDAFEPKPGEAKADPARETDAGKMLKEGEDSLRSRTYGEKGAVHGSSITPDGAATARDKQAANGSLVAQQEERQTDVPIAGRQFSERSGKAKEDKKREAKSGGVGMSELGPADINLTGERDRRVTDEAGQKGQQQAELEVRTESHLTGTEEAKDLSKKTVSRDKEAAGAYYGHFLNPLTLRRVESEKPAASGQPKAAQVGGVVKESTQDNKAPGPYFERKFVEEKKEGDRADGGNARTAPARKVETTSLFGPSLSVIPVSEPTQLPAKFKAFGVNQFIEAASQPFSTFSIDVDTASYTVSRNYMLRGQRPPAEAVRTEEFVNFFDYAYAAPTRETFRIYAEAAPSRFGRGMHMLKIGVKGKRLGREEERGAVLTFLVDTSGSMDKPDRIGLIRKSLKMLIEKLGSHDQVAVVQFDSSARLALDHTPASEKDRIAAVLDSLQCSGSTHLEGGMTRAYQVAARSFKPGAENRVLILSDGVANLGTMAAEDILSKVEAYRKQGIYCSVFGFGIGTFDDTMLETLANKGNGTYAFIDSETEAKRVFVDDLASTLNTIASDVKIQVEFNPKRVAKYRQLGYENRQLKKEDFRNDAVDAGEVGSGQSVTALYEVELKDGRDVLASVRLRYRRTDNGRVEEIERTVTSADVRSEFEKADARFRLAACVAEFSEQLRGSPHAAGTRFADVAEVLQPVALELRLDTRVQELLRLVGGAGSLSLNAQ